VSKQHLYHAQIGTVIHQMGGKCVAQRVWGQVAPDPGVAGILANPVPERLSRYPRRLAGNKQSVTGCTA
jgi:hypothetical protein